MQDCQLLTWQIGLQHLQRYGEIFCNPHDAVPKTAFIEAMHV